uniref:GLTP domain-containing protein n=1 Tax=Hymenolepis diminuta TaxID=6216 RepID=A0A0R3SCZ4_HYMDI
LSHFVGAALYPVKSDVNGNIVVKMLARENEANIAKKDSSGSVGLLWLSRGVELIIESLAELVRNPDEKMSNLVKIAYEKTLRPYHNRVMSLIFSVSLSCLTCVHFLTFLKYLYF